MDQDPVQLRHVSLRGASLSRPRARKVHAPRRERAGAKLLALVVVERVLGIDGTVGDPVQGLAKASRSRPLRFLPRVLSNS
jgi:hypothetical protein